MSDPEEKPRPAINVVKVPIQQFVNDPAGSFSAAAESQDPWDQLKVAKSRIAQLENALRIIHKNQNFVTNSDLLELGVGTE